MRISIKDILNDTNAMCCLCDMIAEKLVNKGLFDNGEIYDLDGTLRGVEEILKDGIKEKIQPVAEKIITSETEKMLKEDWALKQAIRETIKKYIVNQFDEMTKR